MKLAPLFLLSLLFWQTSQSQTYPAFSKFYKFSDTIAAGGSAFNVIPFDSSFIISGVTYTKEFPGQVLFFSKLNYFGDTLWRRLIGKPNHNLYTQNPGTFIKLKDGNLLQSGVDENYEIKDPLVHASPYLLKLDTDGDTIFFKIYDKGIIERVLNEIVELEDGSILGVGHSTDSILMDNGLGVTIHAWYYNYVVRYSATGEVLWEQTFNRTYVDWITELYSAVQARDGGYILAGTKTRNKSAEYPPLNPVYYKMDTSGNVIWEKVYGSQEHSNFQYNELIKSKGGDIFLPQATEWLRPGG